VDNHAHFARGAFNFDARDAGFFRFSVDHFADGDVLVKLIGVIFAFSVPATRPRLVNT